MPSSKLMYSSIFSEFDNWYAESFLNQADESTSVAAGHGVRPGIFIPYNPNAMVRCLYFDSGTPSLAVIKFVSQGKESEKNMDINRGF